MFSFAENSPSGDSAHLAPPPSQRAFAVALLSVAGIACLLAGWFPVGVSIVAVFLFAGPHNWIEARYLMTRMPPKWGPLRRYFLTGIAGVIGLTASFASFSWIGQWANWSPTTYLIAVASWNTALVVWVLTLVHWRSQQNPRRDWNWTIPAGLFLITLTWIWPLTWDLGLVYLHPLMALWFQDRELRTHRAEWRSAYRYCLLMVPVLLGVLWWQLSDSPSLSGNDLLTSRIAAHAGAELLSGISSRLLVAIHVFLEVLHYGVWIAMIPLVSLESAPWRIQDVPLAKRSPRWKWGLSLFLVIGAMLVLALWAGFFLDYPLTRDIYFTVAMLHVLAEIPFLLRLL